MVRLVKMTMAAVLSQLMRIYGKSSYNVCKNVTPPIGTNMNQNLTYFISQSEKSVL